MLIHASQVVFGYPGRAVVSVPAFELARGKCVGVFGPNGAGKTTMLRGLARLMPATAGEVQHAPDLRLGYIPQHRGLELHWPMNAFDAAGMALSARRRFGWLNPASRRRIADAIRDLDVSDLAGRPFAKLSGGQQQRVLLAGALAADPAALLLDEPTEGLDVRSRAGLLGILRRELDSGRAIVLVSHEVEDHLELADTVAWLHPAASAGGASAVELVEADSMPARLASIRSAATTAPGRRPDSIPSIA